MAIRRIPQFGAEASNAKKVRLKGNVVQVLKLSMYFLMEGLVLTKGFNSLKHLTGRMLYKIQI